MWGGLTSIRSDPRDVDRQRGSKIRMNLAWVNQTAHLSVCVAGLNSIRSDPMKLSLGSSSAPTTPVAARCDGFFDGGGVLDWDDERNCDTGVDVVIALNSIIICCSAMALLSFLALVYSYQEKLLLSRPVLAIWQCSFAIIGCVSTAAFTLPPTTMMACQRWWLPTVCAIFVLSIHEAKMTAIRKVRC